MCIVWSVHDYTFEPQIMHIQTYMRGTYRLYGESMEIHDLETRGPWAVALLRARGFLNHVFPLDEPYNWFRLCARRIGRAV